MPDRVAALGVHRRPYPSAESVDRLRRVLSYALPQRVRQAVALLGLLGAAAGDPSSSSLPLAALALLCAALGAAGRREGFALLAALCLGVREECASC